MKIRTLMLTTVLIASATGVAFAQMGMGDAAAKQQEMKKDGMTQDSSSKGAATKPSESTTGAGMQTPSKDVAKSPASTDAGIKQEK